MTGLSRWPVSDGDPTCHFQPSRLLTVTALLKRPAYLSQSRFFLGVLGIGVASAFFVWLLAGWFKWMPSLVDFFGVEGLRTPAAITVGALLLAAISLWEW